MESPSDKKVMVAGHLCLDISPTFPPGEPRGIGDIFSPGKLTTVQQAVMSVGGPVANTGLAMAKLGADVLLNGKIGDDAFGHTLRRLVGEERAATLRVDTEVDTSYTIVVAPPNIDRMFLHHPGANDTFGAEDIDYELAASCALFHYGYPPVMRRMYEAGGADLRAMYERVKALRVTTSLDMAMPDPASAGGQADWQAILESVMPHVDICLPSIDEIAFMIDRPRFDERAAEAQDTDPVMCYTPGDCAVLAERLLEWGAAVVAIKCGVRGLYLRTADADRIAAMGAAAPADAKPWADRELWAASFKTDHFASALGAGDATIAGFLCGLLAGFAPANTLLTANTVGLQNVQTVDTLSGIQTWARTLEMLSETGRPRNETGLDETLWRLAEDGGVYHGPNDGSPG